MNCSALAPVPITATLRPDHSMSWRQAELWKWGPAKSSMPSISGIRGRLSWPTADTTAETVIVSVASPAPSPVVLRTRTVQRRAWSSQVRDSTLDPKRIRSPIPHRRAQSRK